MLLEKENSMQKQEHTSVYTPVLALYCDEQNDENACAGRALYCLICRAFTTKLENVQYYFEYIQKYQEVKMWISDELVTRLYNSGG